MAINAHLYHDADDYRAESCEIEKIIEIGWMDYTLLFQSPLQAFDFIRENKGWMRRDEGGVNHCLLALGEGGDDGILICSEGCDYARFSAHIPNARQIAAQDRRPKCIADLEKRLTGACDKIISLASAYIGEGPYRVLISDLQETHDLDKAYTPLLLAALGERADAFEFEDIGDEIVIYRQEEEQERGNPLPGPSPLPFAPERLNQLLDKALDWIGMTQSGGGLYSTLSGQLHMSDEEIYAAGFCSLEEYFERLGEGETAAMKLE